MPVSRSLPQIPTSMPTVSALTMPVSAPYNAGRAELAAGKAKLEEGQAAYDANAAKLSEAHKAYDEGVAAIASR